MYMIKLSNTKLLSITTRLLILALVSKTISLVLMWVLPSDGVSLSLKENYQPKYQRVDFKNMLNTATKPKKVNVSSSTGSGINITNMLLKGLYGTKDNGFVIVSLKSSPDKTTILGIGEVFSAYKLKEISRDSANFTKDGSTFTLYLLSVKQKVSLENKLVNSNKYIEVDNEPITQQVVTRQDIAYYAKNPRQIWKEISIFEVKTKDKKGIKGFKVTRIDPKSKFATMGLKKGDLIIKANNVKLKSYRDALAIYTKIDKIDLIQIVIIRNGIEKEIVYEIN